MPIGIIFEHECEFGGFRMFFQMVGYEDEMLSNCLGTISELYDGNPPFQGRGAISFAMNVAEILRALEMLEKYQYK